MPVENATTVPELDETWPLGTDGVNEGDDHLRLVKACVKASHDDLLALIGDGGMPTGAMAPFGGSAAPAGFVLCNGAAIDRTTYADLYIVIGTTYGAGNGTTTFNVPDMRGRVAAGDDGASTRGDTAGKDTWVAADLPAHTHTISSSGAHSHQIKQRQSQAQGFSSVSKTVYDYENETYTANTETDGAHSHTVQNTGSGGDNRQKTMYHHWIIKT